MRKVAALAPIVLAVMFMAGCSGGNAPAPTSAAPTEEYVEFEEGATLPVSAESFAARVADAVEANASSRPDIDCGDAALDLSDGKVITCSFEDDGTEYDVEATVMLNATASDYTLSTQVLN
jgi:PBP1b-binding outer membrane lipoprotein LpoB